jgi:hypothetical protein
MYLTERGLAQDLQRTYGRKRTGEWLSFMSKTKHNRPTKRFWLVLGGLNVLALFYPVSLFLDVTSGDGQLFPSLLFLGILFVLAIADTVSIVFAYLL